MEQYLSKTAFIDFFQNEVSKACKKMAKDFAELNGYISEFDLRILTDNYRPTIGVRGNEVHILLLDEPSIRIMALIPEYDPNRIVPSYQRYELRMFDQTERIEDYKTLDQLSFIRYWNNVICPYFNHSLPEITYWKGNEAFDFNKKTYPVRTIKFCDGDTENDVIIGTESFEDALMPNGADFASERARSIDEEIFFYVPDQIFFTTTDAQLADYVKKNL